MLARSHPMQGGLALHRDNVEKNKEHGSRTQFTTLRFLAPCLDSAPVTMASRLKADARGVGMGSGLGVKMREVLLHSEKQIIERRDNVASVCGQPVYDCTQVRSCNRCHARYEQNVLDVGHLHHGRQPADRTGHARARDQWRDDPITTGVSEFGLQNGYKRESPTRLRYRVVEHIVLAHELGSSAPAAW